MAQHNESVFSRLSRHSPLRDSDLLAWNVDNDNTIRKLLRKGIGIRSLQKKYLSLCHASRPSVRPSKDLAQGLGAGEIVWDLTASDKQETLVIAALLIVWQKGEGEDELLYPPPPPPPMHGCLAGRRRPMVEIVTALCKALPSLSVLRTLELEGLRRAFDKGETQEALEFKLVPSRSEILIAIMDLPLFDALGKVESTAVRSGTRINAPSASCPARENRSIPLCLCARKISSRSSDVFSRRDDDRGQSQQSVAGASRLARGLKANSSLKSFAMRSVRLNESRAQAALSAALACHPSIVTLSLEHCGLVGEAGGRLISSVIRAHAARREEMVWSAGLRKPSGLVGHTTAAAPGRIVTAGCLMVDVSGNRLGDVGVHVVARGLQSDTWLVGLNLSNNGVTDRGATLLSLCLQHNSTLCALVLDGNPAISPEAEHRIDRELETRSSMPETVLDEPEVASALEGWGFTPHTSQSDEGGAIETSGSAPLPPSGPIKAIASETETSEILENESVLVDEDKREVSAAAKPGRTYGSHTQPKSGAGPATQEAPRDTDEDAIESRTCRDGIQPASTLTSDEAIPAVPIEAGDDAAGTRTRSRSVSCRSRFRSADAEVWSTRRSRSSGPPGRERCSTAGDRTCEEASALGSMTRRRRRRREPEAPAGRVPWGAGPRAPGARARAHAWAHSQLASSGRGVGVAHRGSRKAGGCCSGHSCNGRGEPSSGRSARHLASTSRVGNQSLRESRTRRGKATKRAWEEGGGEVDKTPYSSGISGTGATEYPGRTAGLDKPNRKRDLGTGDEREPCPVSDPAFSLVESGEPSKSRGGDVVAPAAPEEAHHDPGSSLKEDAGPRGERQEAGSTTSPDTAPEADRTARVVRMLAALEEVVAVVCQDMWRLEDRIEGSVALANRLSQHQLQQHQLQQRNQAVATTKKATGERGEARPREVGHATVQVSPPRSGDPVRDEDLRLPPGEGIPEITAQVEARLREMWRSMPGNTPGESDRDPIARERVLPAGGRKASEVDEDPFARRHREADQSAIPPDPCGLPRTEPVGDVGGSEGLRKEPLQSTAVEAAGTAQSEEEGDAEEEAKPAKGSSEDNKPRQGAGGAGGGAEAERPVPAGIGGEGWGGALQDGDRVEGFEGEGTRASRPRWQGRGEKLHEDAGWIPDKIRARNDNGDLCVQECIELSSSGLETEAPEAAGTASTAAATILFPAISPGDPSEGVAKLGRVILEGAEGGDEYSSDEFDDEEHDEFEEYGSIRFHQVLA